MQSLKSKGFTLGVKAKIENIFKNLPLYGPDLTPRHQKIKIPLNLRGQFATLGVNVAARRFCCLDEIPHCKVKVNSKANPVSPSSFDLPSCSLPLVELLCLFASFLALIAKHMN
jgi:hypothetical protein